MSSTTRRRCVSPGPILDRLNTTSTGPRQCSSEPGSTTPIMADEEDTPMRTEEEEEEESGSGSGSDSSSEEEQIEWLATTRQKRTTAGNRLASLIQQEESAGQEEPDDDLELLFVETEDDVGFDINAAQDDSDVQMDSSSDEEDQGPTAGADELDGEKAIQKAERAERIAKKRKLAQIPGIKKKKVKIDPRVPLKPAPKPKKKSERASWLPTAEDAPTRASSRKSSKLSKEQLHQQMVERELKRLKQLANMEKAQARKDAMKKPELTQADRLKEAARIEKSNAKSLSRWEQAENLREKTEREKLAALHNRVMEGPVITTWSGMATYIGGKLRKLGKNVTIEEKEKPNKKRKAAEMEAEETEKAVKLDESSVAAKEGTSEMTGSGEARERSSGKPDGTIDSGGADDGISPAAKQDGSTKSAEGIPVLGGRRSDAKDGNSTSGREKDGTSRSESKESDNVLEAPTKATPNETLANGQSKPNETTESSTSNENTRSSEMPQIPGSEESEPSEPNLSAPATGSPDVRPPESAKDVSIPPHVVERPIVPAPIPPRSSLFAPPAGLPLTAPPYPPPKSQYSSILGPPRLDGSAPLPGFGYNFQRPPLIPAQNTPFTFNPPQPPPGPPPPPAIEEALRQSIIFYNFDEEAIKSKDTQTQILFRQKFAKVRRTKKDNEVCAITGLPAKYRDPSTGLPYASPWAFKEIQRLKRGEYKWSKLVGAYVGPGTHAARGVPVRFLNKPVPAPAANPLNLFQVGK